MKLQQVLLYAFLLLWLTNNAQQPRFGRIGLSDGLSQSSVYTIFNDSKGFIWLGTGDGLNRYDGHTIKVYKTEFNPRVKGNGNFYDNGAAEAANNDIYFSGRTGVVRYKAQADKIELFYPLNDTFSFNKMMLVLGIVNHNLYLFDCHAHIYVYHTINHTLKRIAISDPVSKRTVFRHAQMDKNNRIWYSLYQGIACYDIKTNRVRYYLQDEFKKRKISLFSGFAECNISNDVLVTTECFVARLNVNTGNYTILIDDATKMFHNAVIDNKGTVWISSNNSGLYSYTKDGTLTNYIHYPNNLESLGSNITTRLFIDQSENLWIGCDGQGVSKLNLASYKFRLYRAGYKNTFKLNTNFIKCFYEDINKKVWIGTYNDGIHVWDRKTDDVVVIKRPEANANIVSSMATINKNAVLVGCMGGVYVVDVNTKKQSVLHVLQKDAPNNSSFQVTHILQLTKQDFLISTFWGLYVVKVNDKQVISSKRINEVPSHMCTQMHKSKDGTIWLGTLGGGLVKMRAKGTRMLVENELLNGYNVKSFYEDTVKNILWLATEKGLISYHLGLNTYRVITTKDGLSDNYLYGILKGDEDELWLSSNKGLMCYHTNSKQVVAFDESDGLQSNEFNTGSFFRSTSGELFFGGINGFNAFYPKEVKFNNNQPNVVLTQLKVQDKEMENFGNAALLSSITLSHDQNTFSFDFAATEYTNPLKNRYQYKLEGADENWVYSGFGHFSRYTTLSPGKYIFWVRACNNDGVWGKSHRLITVVVKPAWWQTWWALGIFLTLVAVTAVFSIRYVSTRKLKLRLKELEAVNKERTRISKDMHDDLGSGLSKIAIMTELLKPQIGHDEELKRKVEKISQTAGELVDNMGQIVWTMNASNDTLESLLAYIREYSLDFFDDTDIKCRLKIEDVNDKLMMNQQQRRNVFLVVKETLNNTLKHSRASEVNIHFNITQQEAKLVISDNGLGFDIDNNRRFGNGLINMKKRMEAIDGTYLIKSADKLGTTTTLTWHLI